MQQENAEIGGDDGRQEQQPVPLRCPRCNSTDTKFRYYNNNDPGQPRHYCKTCRRYWTVGGSMRNIPFGGNRRASYDKPAKDSSSSSHGSLSAPIPPANSYDPHDEISCLAAIQSLTQPAHVGSQSFDARNLHDFGGGMNLLQDGTFQPNYMAALNQTALPQAQLPVYGGNYPNWPMMNPALPQDFNNDFNFSAANAGFWSNSGGNTDDPETARASVMNSNDEWPHLPTNYGGPP